MIDLDNEQELKNLDPGRVAESIESFPTQVKQAWEEVGIVSVPADYANAKNIVVAGMGGSTLGVDILRNLFKDSLSVPLVINNHYQLPEFVNQDTLVLLLSYSGSTEEVLAAANDAKGRGAKILGIAEGGLLGDFLTQNNYPAYLFKPLANPSNQPRLGLGYTFVGTLAFLSKLGFLKVTEDEIAATVAFLEEISKGFLTTAAKSTNQAKIVAEKMVGRQVIIISSEFLSGNAHVFANQTNENSKNLATYYAIPELNHHLLEGLNKPDQIGQSLVFVFFESNFYSEKIKKRITVTKEVLSQQTIPTISLTLRGATKLAQALEGVILSSWATFYLGVLNGVDASKIPWVDYFKKRLSEGS